MERIERAVKKTVLIVDDEQELVQNVVEYLAQYRDFFEVVTAGNGREALEVLESRQVTAVVTDIQMPEMNGVMLLTHMMNDYPTIPCIIITAYATPELEEQLHQFGHLGLLEKPFDLASLRKKIIEALEDRREQDSLHTLSLEAFLQILEMERQSAIVEILLKGSGEKGYLYVSRGELVDASFHQMDGEEAVYEIVALPKSETTVKVFLREVTRKRTIRNKMMHVLMEATHRLDERKLSSSKSENNIERGMEMMKRTTSEIFSEILQIPGLQAVVAIAKDGYVIEMAGSARNVDLDGLGGSLALIFNGVDQMGKDLHLKVFQILTVEYGDALIVCQPIGDAVLALVAPDSKSLGMIRFKSKKLVEELSVHF